MVPSSNGLGGRTLNPAMLGSNPTGITIWSLRQAVQVTALSRRRQGFESPRDHHMVRISVGLPRKLAESFDQGIQAPSSVKLGGFGRRTIVKVGAIVFVLLFSLRRMPLENTG